MFRKKRSGKLLRGGREWWREEEERWKWRL